MYSIGVGGHWGFEDMAAGHPRLCTVHAFDPTIELREAHERHQVPRVHFHFAGLGGLSPIRRAASNTENAYGTVDATRYLTLQQMVSTKGGMVLAEDAAKHYPNTNREPNSQVNSNGGKLPSVVKIDCEGCEWEALAQMASESPEVLSKVRLLFLEVHVARTLVPPTVTAEAVTSAWEFLVLDLGFRLWYVRPYKPLSQLHPSSVLVVSHRLVSLSHAHLCMIRCA